LPSTRRRFGTSWIARRRVSCRSTSQARSFWSPSSRAWRAGNFPGDVAFTLHDTYGFPVEVTREVLAERGVSLDEAGYEAAMDAQRSRAREAAQGYDRAVAAFGGRRSGAGSSATSARG
jgi:alanyl-tRNA synthetase